MARSAFSRFEEVTANQVIQAEIVSAPMRSFGHRLIPGKYFDGSRREQGKPRAVTDRGSLSVTDQ